MSLKVRGTLLTVLGLACLAAAALATHLQFLAVALGFVFFFLAGTVFSNAAQLVRSLRPWRKKRVSVEVWGMSQGLFEIDSISAFGAGLLIFLRPAAGGPQCLLKIAQPGAASLEAERLEIGQAAYVRWAGRKLKPAAETKAPALVLRIPTNRVTANSNTNFAPRE